MSKYQCSNCGYETNKWMGKCTSCDAWDASIEIVYAGKKVSMNGAIIPLSPLKGDALEDVRFATNILELDRVLGGGLVVGSAVLIGGEPGIGKSTLIMQICAKFGEGAIYVSGEESVKQISMRAHRLNLHKSKMRILPAMRIEDIISTIKQHKATKIVVIDSIQTVYVEDNHSGPGSVNQIRACTQKLIEFTKMANIALLIVGHVTKEGQIAGPKILEHAVDTVLYFEGKNNNQFRLLRSVKNRFGNSDEVGIFEMHTNGLHGVSNPSKIFLESECNTQISGTAIFAGIEGTRPIMVEIQALSATTYMSNPRRSVIGWDINRLSMILAVLNARCNLDMTNKEVYLNIAGGLKISEPAADLAVALAIISSHTNSCLTLKKCVIFGEIALSGEVRKVNNMDARIKETLSLGFHNIIMPKSTLRLKLPKINIIEISHVTELKNMLS